MNDIDHRMNAARALLEVETSHGDTERALMRFKDLGRRRKRRRTVAAGAAGGAIAAAMGWIAVMSTLAPAEQPVEEIAKAAPQPASSPILDRAQAIEPVKISEAEIARVIYFPDGSHAALVKPRTQIWMEALSDDLLELTMAAGEARFEVQPNPRRLFRVRTDDLRIEVLGTSFTVTEEEGTTRVIVHRGRVAVYQAGNRHELGAGMTLSFDGERAVVEGEEVRAEERPRAKKHARKRRSKSVDRRWKRLAEKGDFAAAYQAMSSAKERPVGDETQELMLAADVARLTGHPREAAGYLEQVVDRHQSHPRAMLAAFTLGRIRQHELDDPKRAAAAFHTAYSLAPTGSLAEDALAHEIECWVRAGQTDRAKARATEYLERYPNGRKHKQVRRLGTAL